MQIRYIVLAVFLFIIFQMSLIPLENTAVSTKARENLQTLSNLGVTHDTQTWGPVAYFMAPVNYFSSLYDIVTSPTPVFSGGFEYVRWLVFTPLLAGIMFGFIMLFFNLFQKVLT